MFAIDVVARSQDGETAMELTVRTADFHLTTSANDLIQRRWEAIDRIGGSSITNANLEIRTFQPHRGADIVISQLTMTAGKHLIRAEERSIDGEAAISASLDKGLNQVRSYLGKRKSLRVRGQQPRDAMLRELAEESRHLGESITDDVSNDEKLPAIVRTKRFEMKPMTPDEAADQMDLLGHDFYFFNNSETGSHSVLYRRQDGDLGMLMPDQP
jgi:putative sigma-54 modulation protein